MALSLLLLVFFLLISFFSHSSEDPNFLLSENIEIKNFFGFYGSVVSDVFFQSFGLISYLFSLTLILIGINIIFEKKILVFINCLFYSSIYLLLGSLLFTTLPIDNYHLIINGNGGFVGKFLSDSLLSQIFKINLSLFQIIFYILIFFIFFLSINFKLQYIKKIIDFIKKRNSSPKLMDESVKNITDKLKNDTTGEPIQENFEFDIRGLQNKDRIRSFKIPNIKLLEKNRKSNGKEKPSPKIEPSFLEKILLDFGVEGKIKKVSQGPVVTLNEFEPAAGIKVSKIINLSEDIARNTSSESARISTIPGRNTIGIEIPNSFRENVYLNEIISSSNFLKKEIKLPIALGKDISGLPIIADLTSMPHLLIAGTTGSGKSVCINTIILSLLFKHPPDKCKFILIDPKMLELSTYEGVPHLLCPVITEPTKAASVLGWVVKEMESRYRLMTKEGVRNIDGYNSKHKLAMPYIVVIVDEMSDLMLVHGKEIENYIQKLSQMARAAGIHIIMATQRPSVDVITGTIKANFPTRISFQVTSKIDSRTILGEQGAEQLLGKGDMLYMTSANKIVRIHAPFVSEDEIEKVNNYLRTQEEPDYVEEIINLSEKNDEIGESSDTSGKDNLYDEAKEIILRERKASTSFLQRKLQIGYNRAARIMDMMEDDGLVSKANHVGKREVLK